MREAIVGGRGFRKLLNKRCDFVHSGMILSSNFVSFFWYFIHIIFYYMLFTFSALISSIYWCGSVSHKQILMVRHVAAEIIGAANAASAALVSTPK